MNFDVPITRKNTGSVKWDLVNELYGKADLLPLWVADMDFRVPDPVVNAILEKVHKGIFGYECLMPSYYEAVKSWLQKRHQWSIENNWIVYCPGIVPALHFAVQAFTKPGDGIIVQRPVYYPFMKAVQRNDRKLLNNPLILENGHYRIDFSQLEDLIKKNSPKMLIFCNPHNPVGRVWINEELKTLAEICLKYNLLIISDEIHSDLIFNDHKHFPLASFSEELSLNTITLTSPSKTFNMAGLHISNIIIANEFYRNLFKKQMESSGIMGPNSFGPVACEAAYNKGEDWLNALLNYIWGNYMFLKTFIDRNLPEISITEPQGTYLVWLDFRKIEPDKTKLRKIILEKAGLALDDGFIFGTEGDGFQRINIGCPRSVLNIALEKLLYAFK